MNGISTEPQLVKKRELARILSMSPRFLDDLIAQRAIPFLNISRRLHLFDPAAVRAALHDLYAVHGKKGKS